MTVSALAALVANAPFALAQNPKSASGRRAIGRSRQPQPIGR
jgi:hypothetical protein